MNQFAHLSAESGEHRLAQVTSEETFQADNRVECYLEEADYGDEDRPAKTWEVKVGPRVLFCHPDKVEAAFWANENGYRIVE